MENNKRYKTVVIDFPWKIKMASNIESLQGSSLNKKLDYETLSDEEIEEFPIDQFADLECLLFIWATSGKLESGIPVIEKACSLVRNWGFSFRTILYWKKPSGLANYIPFRSEVEPIVFATRKISSIKPFAKYSCMIEAKNDGHSIKPHKFYRMLRQFSPKPRIDIFARNAHEGFDGYGDQYVGDGSLSEFL